MLDCIAVISGISVVILNCKYPQFTSRGIIFTSIVLFLLMIPTTVFMENVFIIISTLCGLSITCMLVILSSKNYLESNDYETV